MLRPYRAAYVPCIGWHVLDLETGKRVRVFGGFSRSLTKQLEAERGAESLNCYARKAKPASGEPTGQPFFPMRR